MAYLLKICLKCQKCLTLNPKPWITTTKIKFKIKFKIDLFLSDNSYIFIDLFCFFFLLKPIHSGIIKMGTSQYRGGMALNETTINKIYNSVVVSSDWS